MRTDEEGWETGVAGVVHDLPEDVRITLQDLVRTHVLRISDERVTRAIAELNTAYGVYFASLQIADVNSASNVRANLEQVWRRAEALFHDLWKLLPKSQQLLKRSFQDLALNNNVEVELIRLQRALKHAQAEIPRTTKRKAFAEENLALHVRYVVETILNANAVCTRESLYPSLVFVLLNQAAKTRGKPVRKVGSRGTEYLLRRALKGTVIADLAADGSRGPLELRPFGPSTESVRRNSGEDVD